MSWSHKNGADWRAEDCVVFREWDLLKGRSIQETPHYWMEAKQRFRAALSKVSVLGDSDKEEHKYSKVSPWYHKFMVIPSLKEHHGCEQTLKAERR